MDPCVLPSSLCSKPTFLNPPSFRKQPSSLSTAPHRRRRPLTVPATGPAASDGGESNEADDTAATAVGNPQPPEPLRIRYRPRSRNQERRRREEEGDGRRPPLPAKKKKDWEEMTVGEKAVELYVGEKGILFWLNKFAYASIFIIIGGWILFRFVGPNLGLYQLDAPPLPPTAIFKGTEGP